MKELICNKCREFKKEIEFEYYFFKKEYSRTCKQCESQTKFREDVPGEDLVDGWSIKA